MLVRRGLRAGAAVGEGSGTAVTGGGPHRGLQHLHGVAPLAAGAGDCRKSCLGQAGVAGQRGRGCCQGALGGHVLVCYPERQKTILNFLAADPPFPTSQSQSLFPPRKQGVRPSPSQSPGQAPCGRAATSGALIHATQYSSCSTSTRGYSATQELNLYIGHFNAVATWANGHHSGQHSPRTSSARGSA